MSTITTDDITGKKEELAKKIKQYADKIEQWRKELEALEITERLLTGSTESSTDKKRREIGEAVLQCLPAGDATHYKLIAVSVSKVLGREIKPNAMYNFLNRAIEKGDLPITKLQDGLYERTKGPGDADGVSVAVSVQN